jgi:AraC-like DNA-binding protein
VLLTTTFLSVKQIVRRVGLTDESHFVRDFKRSYGVTPGEYRKPRSKSSTQLDSSTNSKFGQLIFLAVYWLLY